MSGHDELPELDFKFLSRLRRRSLFRVAMAYLGTAWFVFHVVTVFGETFEPVHHFTRTLAYLLAAGLPLVLTIAWLRDRKRNRGTGTDAAQSAQGLQARARRLDVFIAVLLVFAIIALTVDRFVFHRPIEQSMLVLLGLIVVLLVLDRLLNRGSGAQMIPVDATSNEPRVAILPVADMSAEKDQD